MKLQLTSVFLAVAVIAGSGSLIASPAQTTPPDNTKTNKQGGQTASDQSEAKADLALTQRIRQAVLKDKTLSVDAHNCKVITQHGMVTLRGPVKTNKEKDAVNRIALKIAEGKVT